MSVAEETTETAGETGWRARLAAWWTGKGDAAPQAEQVARRMRQSNVPRAAIGEADRERILQIEAPQYVFGPGRSGPGSATFYEKLMAPLNPTQERNLLVVGAGLGGSARMLHERFGARVVGLDASAAVAAKATELIETAGQADRIELKAFNPEGPKFPGRSFDCALVEPLLFAVHNKLELLRELDLTLKGGGQTIVLDFVLGGLTDDNQNDWRSWLDNEKPRPRVRTAGEQKELFAKAKLKVRQTSDITPVYLQMITRSWARCLDRIEGRPRAELHADPMLRGVAELAEYWGRRAMLMETGALKVMRYHIGKAKFGG